MEKELWIMLYAQNAPYIEDCFSHLQTWPRRSYIGEWLLNNLNLKRMFALSSFPPAANATQIPPTTTPAPTTQPTPPPMYHIYCEITLHGCCPDNRTAASGPNQHGCAQPEPPQPQTTLKPQPTLKPTTPPGPTFPTGT